MTEINKLVTSMVLAGVPQAMKLYDRLNAGMRKGTEQATTKVEKKHEDAAKKSAKYWIDATGRMRDANGRFVANATGNLGKMAAAYRSFFKTIGNVKLPGMGGLGGMIPGLAAVGGAGAIGKGIFDAGKDFERLQAALFTATGGQKQADEAYKRIESFARKTPYDLNQVAEAFIKLKNMGLDPSEAALTSYGNTAGAMGKDLMQMIEAVADATTGEFERLKEFGIKAKSEGDNVTFTFRGVSKTMKKDAASIQKYLLDIGNVQFAGGMARQAGTIGGMTSTLGDNFQALGRAVWTAGAGPGAKALVKWMTDTTDKLIPWVEKHLPKFIDQGIKLGQKVLPSIPPLLEGIAAGLMGIGAGYAYMKTVAAADVIMKMVMAWRAMDAAQKAAAISGMLANATVFAIPIAIGAAVAAVVWFGWQVYKYLTGGQKELDGLRERFPWLADSIAWVGDRFKEWWPTIQYIANLVGKVLVVSFNLLMAAARFVYEGLLKPMFLFWIGKLGVVWKSMQDLYKIALPYLITAFDNFKISMDALFTGFRIGFKFLEEKFPWLKAIVDAIGKAANNGWFAGFGGETSNPSDVSGSATGLAAWDPSLANRMVASIKGVHNAAKMCLNAVWQGQQRVLGGKSPITAERAYQAADQLARSSQFQEITGVTPQMLNDPQIKRLLNGATVIYNRQSGFSTTSGHAEIWDTFNNGAYYGRGKDSISRRNAHMLRNARFFIPVQNGQGGRGAMNVQQVINVNVTHTNATPAQIQGAVKRGASDANRNLNGAATTRRVSTTVNG